MKHQFIPHPEHQSITHVSGNQSAAGIASYVAVTMLSTSSSDGVRRIGNI